MPRRLLLLLVAVTCLVAACENDVDTTPNVFPSDEGSTVQDVNLQASCSSCLVPGSWYRFDQLQLVGLDGNQNHPVISVLNGLWAEDIGIFELNVMFEIKEVSETNVVVDAINAARVGTEGAICLIPETRTTLRFGLDGCQLTDSEPSNINIYAGNETNPKNCSTTQPVRHAIPITNLKIAAAVTEDCSSIVNGTTISAVFSDKALEEICTCARAGDFSDVCEPLEADYADAVGKCAGCNGNYRNLRDLLSRFSPLQLTCTDPDGDPAVCLDAVFSAQPWPEPPPVCSDLSLFD